MGRVELAVSYSVSYNFIKIFNTDEKDKDFTSEIYFKKVEMLLKLAQESDSSLKLESDQKEKTVYFLESVTHVVNMKRDIDDEYHVKVLINNIAYSERFRRKNMIFLPQLQ